MNRDACGGSGVVDHPVGFLMVLRRHPSDSVFM